MQTAAQVDADRVVMEAYSFGCAGAPPQAGKNMARCNYNARGLSCLADNKRSQLSRKTGLFEGSAAWGTPALSRLNEENMLFSADIVLY